MKSVPRRAVEDEVKIFNKQLKKNIASATGGNSALSGTGNRPKLSVKTSISGSDFVKAHIEPAPAKAKAIHYWVEFGTNPHLIHKGQVIRSPAKAPWGKASVDFMDDLIDAISRRIDEAL